MQAKQIKMAKGFSRRVGVCSWLLMGLWWVAQAEAELKEGFYDQTCPKAEDIVREVVEKAVAKEKRMGASLVRLHFHDCFVNGCDGSILLDGSSGEKFAGPNNNSARGFNVVDSIKSQLESACPATVSCADVLAMAARDSVVALGGPTWAVKLGRRDSLTSSQTTANKDIPGPNSTLNQLISKFSAKGLNSQEMVALSGVHTIGKARCFSFRSRVYSDSDIDASLASARRSSCPSTSGNGDQHTAPLDLRTPTNFDNNYYRNLLSQKGLLHSDQQLFSGGGSAEASQVQAYASDQDSFFSDFAAAMIKMGDISPLTGSSGEIRTNCRRPN